MANRIVLVLGIGALALVPSSCGSHGTASARAEGDTEAITLHTKKWGAGSPCAPAFPNRYDYQSTLIMPRGNGRFTPPDVTLRYESGAEQSALKGSVERSGTRLTVRLRTPIYDHNTIDRYEDWDANGVYEIR